MDGAKSFAEARGVKLAVISDNELGHYNWEIYWRRISPDEKTKQNYLQPSRLIKKFCAANGIGFIDSEVPHQRARNDPHPNTAGNEAMAENALRYIMKYHKAELEPYRR